MKSINGNLPDFSLIAGESLMLYFPGWQPSFSRTGSAGKLAPVGEHFSACKPERIGSTKAEPQPQGGTLPDMLA
jgi:hypothetical protein